MYLFSYFISKIDCGYTLEPPRRGGSNATHNLCLGAKIRKIGIPLHTPVLVGYKEVYIIWTCYRDLNEKKYDRKQNKKTTQKGRKE